MGKNRVQRRKAASARGRQSAVAKSNNQKQFAKATGNGQGQVGYEPSVRGEVDVVASRPMSMGGLTGLERHSGLVFEEFLPTLKGRKGVAIFKEMRDNDPICGAILFAIEKMMRQVHWSAEKGGDSPDHEEAAKFLDESMNDMAMTWSDVITEIASMFTFGWAYHEIVYKFRNGDNSNPAEPSSRHNDGRIGWRKMPLMGQETLHKWDFSNEGAVNGMIQRPAPTYEEILIPIEKALLFRTTVHKGNPEGRSIFRNAYRPWYFKKRIEEIEAIGVERDLAGLPMVYAPAEWFLPTASKHEQAMLKEYVKLVTNVRRDTQEGIVMPAFYDSAGNQLLKLELLSSGGTRMFNTDGIINRYERSIAMTVLADWLMLGHTQSGSWALSSDKTSLFSVALGAWLDSIAGVFNDYAVPRLFQMNRDAFPDDPTFQVDPLPKIGHGDIETPDLSELGAYIMSMANSGVPLFPNDNLMDALLDAAHLPKPTEADRKAQEEAKQLEEQARQQQAQGALPPGPGAGRQQKKMPPKSGEEEQQANKEQAQIAALTE